MRPSVLPSSLRACALAAALPALAAGCVGQPPPATPPDLDQASFEADVYPILLRDCAFGGCHGDPGRFFRVHGPGRSRLLPETGLAEPPTAPEIALAFDRARSMLAQAGSAESSLLLRKPLEADEGGAPHEGVDRDGRNVYASRADRSWQQLRAWAREGFE